MALLADHGVAVAPWAVLEGEDPGDRRGDLGDDLVVKLADVPHRTELGAVRVGVAEADLVATVAELQGIAAASGAPGRVVAQRRVAGAGEAFVGFRSRTDLGPVIVVGLGGVLVETTRKVVGRLAPVTDADVAEMLEELGGDSVFRGLRGSSAWNKEALARAVLGVAELGLRAAPWLDSIDVNPLICDDRSCTAVDALLVMTDEPAGGT
jgi:hypothetical protein